MSRFLRWIFLKFCTCWDTNATFHILFFGKILSEQFSLMVKNKKSRDIGETVWTTPYFFPCKKLVKIIFKRYESLKKFHPGKIKILKNKDELMANIRHSLAVLLPWQRPMPKEQKLKNKGNYVGKLTGKSQEQRLQDNRIRVSFVTLASSNTHFCRNSREPP